MMGLAAWHCHLMRVQEDIDTDIRIKQITGKNLKISLNITENSNLDVK